MRGDFIGFTINGVHSSEYGIVRVSVGDRYEEYLSPDFQDKTVPIPGGDGSYYFGTNYTQRQFNIRVAYDNITELQIRKMRQDFAAKKTLELVFDETPYKTYKVKIATAPKLSYICFGETGEQRVYKGEGEFSLVTLMPFAYCDKKNASEYTQANKSEWLPTSGLIDLGTTYDNLESTAIKLYNPGDVATDLLLYFTFPGAESLKSMTMRNGALYLEETVKKTPDDGFRINTKNHLIEGWRTVNGEKVLTGNIYNEYITKGDFPKIETNYLDSDGILITPEIVLDGTLATEIEYKYLYY